MGLDKQGISLGMGLGQTLGMCTGPMDVPRPFGQAQAFSEMVPTHCERSRLNPER